MLGQRQASRYTMVPYNNDYNNNNNGGTEADLCRPLYRMVLYYNNINNNNGGTEADLCGAWY